MNMLSNEAFTEDSARYRSLGNVVPLTTAREASLRGRIKVKNDKLERLRKRVVSLETEVKRIEPLELEVKRLTAIVDMLLEDRQQARKPGLLTRLWRFFV